MTTTLQNKAPRLHPALPVLLFLLGLFPACQQDPAAQLKPLNLLEYGLPVTILAPDSAEVKQNDLGFIKDVTVRKGEDFSLQIFASESTTNDLSRIKADQLSEVKANPYFAEIVREEEDGFIYKLMVDSLPNYGFRHFRIQGDLELIFQTGLLGTFSLEEVELMYQAVQPQPTN